MSVWFNIVATSHVWQDEGGEASSLEGVGQESDYSSHRQERGHKGERGCADILGRPCLELFIPRVRLLFTASPGDSLGFSVGHWVASCGPRFRNRLVQTLLGLQVPPESQEALVPKEGHSFKNTVQVGSQGLLTVLLPHLQ